MRQVPVLMKWCGLLGEVDVVFSCLMHPRWFLHRAYLVWCFGSREGHVSKESCVLSCLVLSRSETRGGKELER